MPELLTPSDWMILKKAHLGMATANNIVQFTNAHMVETYKLSGSDQINLDTGEIIREKLPVPEPVDI